MSKQIYALDTDTQTFDPAFTAALSKSLIPGKALIGPGIDPTGAADSTSAITSLISGGGTFFGIPGALYKTGTITVPSNTRLIGNGASIAGTVTTAGAGIFTLTSVDSVEISGWSFTGSLSTFAVKALASTNIRIWRNVCSSVGVFTSSSLSDNYSSSSEGACRFIDVAHNKATAVNTSTGYAAITLRYTSDSSVVANKISGYGHGILWWGGDAATDSAGGTKTRRIIISNNTVSGVGQGGIWGSMGDSVTISANSAITGGDVGIDFEGCTNSAAIGNTIQDFTNGGLTVFYASSDIVFANNAVRQNASCGPAFKAFGSGVSLRVKLQGNMLQTASTSAVTVNTDQSALSDSLFVGNEIISTGSGAGAGTFNQCDRIRFLDNVVRVVANVGINHLGGVDSEYSQNLFVTTSDTSNVGDKGAIISTWVNSTESSQRLRVRGNVVKGFVTGFKDDCGGDNGSYCVVEFNEMSAIWHRGTSATYYGGYIANNRTSNPSTATPVTAV